MVLNTPVLLGLGLLFIAFCFRLTDIFILKLDERWGEILLSKALGFALVAAVVFLGRRTWKDIGIHTKNIGIVVATTCGLTTLAFLLGYSLEIVLSLRMGHQTRFFFAAIDPKALVNGGFVFGSWLIFGNIVNVFMEEGLFRGVLSGLFRRRMGLWKTNFFQAILFAAWHLPWALKLYVSGRIQSPGEICLAVVSNFLPMLLMGLVWGYMYLKSGNLYFSIVDHFLTNSLLNLFHIQSGGELDNMIAIRMTVYTIISVVEMFFVKKIADKYQLPEVVPWE